MKTKKYVYVLRSRVDPSPYRDPVNITLGIFIGLILVGFVCIRFF